LSDENVDARLVPYLRRLGHAVATTAGDHPAILSDVDVLQLANSELRIRITNDHEFGELVVAKRLPPSGVILFRLDPLATLATKIERLDAASSPTTVSPTASWSPPRIGYVSGKSCSPHG
jgi:predicted nuclease of predicted toxin-antitoxin system